MSGRPHPGRRGYTPAERARLAERTLPLLNKGYTQREVSAAAGVSSSTISEAIRHHGKKPPRRNQWYPRPPDLPMLGRILWRDSEVLTEERPLYQRSTTIQLLRQIIEVCQHDNAVVRFASDVDDARQARDQEWLANANYTLGEAMQYLGRLAMVMSNPEARDRAIRDHTERDDLAPLLRIVPDDS